MGSYSYVSILWLPYFIDNYFEMPNSDFINPSISACILVDLVSGYFTTKYANLSPKD